jgi:CRP-like cAMP-binding protein
VRVVWIGDAPTCFGDEELSTFADREHVFVDVGTGDHLDETGDDHEEVALRVTGPVLVEELDRERRVLGVHGPGRFLGELGLLTGEVMFATTTVRSVRARWRCGWCTSISLVDASEHGAATGNRCSDELIARTRE